MLSHDSQKAGAQETEAKKTRAIVCFVENNKDLIQQALALRQSWLHVQSPDTDMVVMGPPAALGRIPDDVVKIEQRGVADDPELFSYRYANSVACLNGVNAWQLDRYSHILRTDVDTFITPAWNRFYPDGFICGNGGYSNDDDVRLRIREIAAEFGLQHRGLINTGSTWYGPTPLLRRMAATTEMLMRYILLNCFRESEGAWPGWYRGVTSMYASEIAINHLAPSAQKSDALDCYSTSRNSVQEYPHIHCWHTDDKFSKHWFVSGRYREEDAENLNLDIIADYAMEMSFRSLPDLADTDAASPPEAGHSPPSIDPPAEATPGPDASSLLLIQSANRDDGAVTIEIASQILHSEQEARDEQIAMSEYHDLPTEAAVTDAGRRAFAAIKRRCQRVTAAREQCVDRLVAAFAKANVRMVILNDAALAHLVYSSPPPCPTADIDILVGTGDIERAVKIACALGYPIRFSRTSLFAGRMHHVPAASKLQSGFEVSLRIHWDAISSDSPGSLTLANLTAAPRPLPRPTGQTGLALDHTDMLRHLARRAFEPASRVSLKHLYELWRYSKVFGKEIDWGDIEKGFRHVNVALDLASSAFEEGQLQGGEDEQFQVPSDIGPAMMPLSAIARMPINARLNALFNPSDWWFHGFYGIPVGKSLLACRTIRHPLMLVRWFARRLVAGA